MTVSLYHPVKRGSIIALYQHWIVGIYAMISLLRHSGAKRRGAHTTRTLAFACGGRAASLRGKPTTLFLEPKSLDAKQRHRIVHKTRNAVCS
jgi:hypothetical protein